MTQTEICRTSNLNLRKAFVHIATIRHLYDVHNEFFIPNFIKNPNWTLTDPIARMLPRELFAAARSRIRRELLNPLYHPLTRFLSIDRFDLFGRRALDDQPIACHCVSFS